MFFGLKKPKRTADLEEGAEVIVEGRVVAKGELTIPNTSIKCVYFYQFSEAWEHGPRGRGRKMWVPKNAAVKCDGFYIDDGTGRVWIGADAESMDVAGGRTDAAVYGKKGRARYQARFFQGGDTVRVSGLVCKPKGAEPGDTLVIRPGKKGVMKIKFKAEGE